MVHIALAALTALNIASHALTVNVSPSQTSSVPLGAQRVPMQTLVLTASCTADVSVSTVTVTHSGLGASSDIERVYAMEGNRRVSRTASLTNNPATATLRFGAFVIPKCQHRTVTVVADISPDAASQSEHAIGVRTASDIKADTSDIALTTGRTVPGARIAPVSRGDIDVEYLPVLTSTTYGTNRTLLRMRLAARGEDQVVRSITLTNEGKARNTDLQRLSLGTRDGALTNVLPSLSGDLATFTFDPPLRLGRGEDILLFLTGDVRASRKKTIRFVVEEEGDIVSETAGR